MHTQAERDAARGALAQGETAGEHPEEGDTVFAASGDDIGPITFFYDRVDATHWRVQVAGHHEDPLLVVSQGGTVTALHGQASAIGPNSMGARIVAQ